MNPIINHLNQQNPMLTMLRPIYNMMQNGNNPMVAINQMAMNDERMKQVSDVIAQNGGIQQAVYAEAMKRNVNPNDALNEARNILQSLNSK